MFKRNALQKYIGETGKILIEKEKGKESTSQIYYGSQSILLTMIASMAQTLVVKNKIFTKEELIEAINLGSQEDESK